MPDRIRVADASPTGATAGVAETLGQTLAADGKERV